MANYGEESGSFTYDAFLSFRGEDTRHTFIRYLHNELGRKGINTFADDNDKHMRIGEGISPSLSQAIEESKIYVIVLSENYASSTWCLWELVKILECKKGNNKRHVFPIFYHVDPSDVRHQTNSYGKAMKAHENRFGENSEKVKTWKSALFQIASLKGIHITTGCDEVKCIEKIVKTVLAEIAPKTLYVGQDPVGLEHRIEQVKSLLDMKSNDDTVSMLGIYGLGGVGKTELAKALYNKIVHKFEAASFLENVREKSKKFNGFEDLQKILLSEMWEESESKFGSTSKGINEIKRKLNKKKVLLVLDDIDDREQLDNLAGECDWFGSGSRIIITTRDKDLLGYTVKKVYEMTELNEQHSLELFCQNAFGKSHPETGYEDMSSHAVDYAKGLPLALKVIGSDLATQKCLEAWKCALKEYMSAPDKRIQVKLKISYDRLEDNAKHVFLDIACFFKGERIEYVKEILEEFNATHNIEVLVNKSLLTVEHGCLKMHDLIQDMGREIVKQEALRNPGKRSRLWSYEDVVDVLTEDSGSDAIQGIMLDPPQREEVEWSGTAFEKMKYLRILIIRNTSFSSGPIYLSNHLRLLDWEEYPSKSFPPKFYPKKIVVINLSKSYLELKEPFKKFSNLTSMDLSRNQSLTAIPDVSELQTLMKLNLNFCENLIEVDESVGFLKKLTDLNAIGCTKLINFPRRMFLPSLEFLNLNSCVRLEHFPDIVNKMKERLWINLEKTAIKELPDSIDNLIGLVYLYISRNKKLRYLPSSFFKMQNVLNFDIGKCPQLREYFRRFVQNPSSINDCPPLSVLHFEKSGLSVEDLHGVLNCFPKLEELNVSHNNFVSLPECIKELVHLRFLDVCWCMKLEHISELPSTIETINAIGCFSLTRKTITMLWSQVSKERYFLEIKMPRSDIPEWFDFRGNGGNPYFWARKKFPIFALALVFQDENENDKVKRFFRQRDELHLVFNGQFVARRCLDSAKNNMLVFDFRRLLVWRERLGLDEFLEHDWNRVEVLCDSCMTLSSWGVFVYKQETNMEDVRFMCPDPKYSC